MPACEECHRVKVKCDNAAQAKPTCSRCLRLEIPCVPRISRQGQGSKKRRKKTYIKDDACNVITSEDACDKIYEDESNITRENNNKPCTCEEDNPPQTYTLSEDVRVFETLQRDNPTSVQPHYGIRYLIHSWTSFAFARRSFALLGRASRLAEKCGVAMDDVYSPQRQAILDPILYNNRSSQQPQTPLDWEVIPPALVQVCQAQTQASRLGRYLWVREAVAGQSRFLATPEFETTIQSRWALEETWKANRQPVVQTFLDDSLSFDKFTQAIQYQTSRYTHPQKPPERVRIQGLRVKTIIQPDSKSNQSKDGPVVRTMDLLYAFEIVTLEQSFYIAELVEPQRCVPFDAHKNTSTTSATSGETARTDPLTMLDELPLVPFNGEEVDPDFEAFLELLKD